MRRSTASTCPRRTARASAWGRRSSPARTPRRSCGRCWRTRSAAPACCSPRPSRRSRPRPRRCAAASASPSASTCGCLTASSGSTSTCSAAAPGCAPGSCPAPRWERCGGDPQRRWPIPARRLGRAAAVTRRATLRGADRTPLAGADARADVLVCGASFAGLAVARELAGCGAEVLVVDRYEIGERQTSACGIPTEWLRVMGLMKAHRQAFGRLVVHTPHVVARLELPWTFSTFDYRQLCELLWDQCDAEFETAKIEGRDGETVRTDRGDVSAPLIVDALGWRRILASDGGYQPPDAPLSRGLEVHPGGSSDDLEIWIDRRYVP